MTGLKGWITPVTLVNSKANRTAVAARPCSMFKTWALVGLLQLGGGVHASGAEPAAVSDADCPAAHTPYSSKTILLDLLINPLTRAVLDKDVPGLLANLPDLITRTTPPTFAAIVDVEWVAASENLPLQAETIASLDADLSSIAVTDAAARARCARYDQGASPLPATVRMPSMLVFSKATGARDDHAIHAAATAFRRIGSHNGWTMAFTESGAAINDIDLSHFTLVVWNNVSGDVLTVPQRAALRRYVESGGGFAAVHGSGGDFRYDWGWYADTLIGARFLGHPRSQGFQDALVLVDDPTNWVTQGLPASWNLTEEWYSFKASPRLSGAHVLLRLDEGTYDPTEGGVDLHMGDHPVAWTKCVGDGRSFYMAMGHRPENYENTNVKRLLARGLAWAADRGPTHCRAGNEIPRRDRSPLP